MGRKREKIDPTKTPTELVKAYLAGFVDGEGCFTISVYNPPSDRGAAAGRWDCRLSVYNSNLDILRHFQEYFGGFIQVRDRSNGGERNWRAAGQIVWTGKLFAVVAKAILPYLVVKKEQAELVLAVQSTRLEAKDGRKNGVSQEVLAFRAGAKKKLHLLNAKGRIAS